MRRSDREISQICAMLLCNYSGQMPRSTAQQRIVNVVLLFALKVLLSLCMWLLGGFYRFCSCSVAV